MDIKRRRKLIDKYENNCIKSVEKDKLNTFILLI
jgi:hypothetical protein